MECPDPRCEPVGALIRCPLVFGHPRGRGMSTSADVSGERRVELHRRTVLIALDTPEGPWRDLQSPAPCPFWRNARCPTANPAWSTPNLCRTSRKPSSAVDLRPSGVADGRASPCPPPGMLDLHPSPQADEVCPFSSYQRQALLASRELPNCRADVLPRADHGVQK
jgi:hypothetical protein